MNDHALDSRSTDHWFHVTRYRSITQSPFKFKKPHEGFPIQSHRSGSSAIEYSTKALTSTSVKKTNRLSIQVNRLSGEGGYKRLVSKNKSPRIVRNNGLQIRKGSEIRFDRTMLQTLDAEQPATQLTYKLTEQPKNGALLLKGVVLSVGDRVTQFDINRGWVSYKSLPNVTQLTTDGSQKQLKGFAGKSIVWEGFDGNDWEIFIQNIVTNQVSQLTHNAVNDKVVGISGSTIVWSRALAKPVGDENELVAATANELLLFNGKKVSLITHDGAIHNDLIAINGSNIFWGNSAQQIFFTNSKIRRRLTQSQYSSIPAVQGSNIIWGSMGDPYGKETFPAQELFWFNGRKTVRLTHNQVDDSGANMDAPHIAWSSDIGPKIGRHSKTATSEVMVFNGKTTTRLTHNRVDDIAIAVQRSHVVWLSEQEQGLRLGDDYDLFLFDGKRQIRLTHNKVDDRLVSLDGPNVFWSSRIGPPWEHSSPAEPHTEELFWFDGKTIRQLTNNGSYETVWAAHGSKLVWTSIPPDVSLTEVFFFDGKKINQLTNNLFFESDAQMTDSTIAWFSSMGPPNSKGFPTSEIMAFDIPTKTTQRLTTNDFSERNLQLSGSNVAWEENVTSEKRELFFANVASGDRFRFSVSDGHGGKTQGTFRITFAT